MIFILELVMSNVTPSSANQPLDQLTQLGSDQAKVSDHAQMRGHEVSLNPQIKASVKADDIYKALKREPSENLKDLTFNITIKEEDVLQPSDSEQANSDDLPDDLFSQNADHKLSQKHDEKRQVSQEREIEIVIQQSEVEGKNELRLARQQIMSESLEKVYNIIKKYEFDFKEIAHKEKFGRKFEKDYSNHLDKIEQNPLTELPHEEILADLTTKLVKKAAEKGEIVKRLANGTHAPLTQAEVEQLTSEIKTVLIEYFRSQLPRIIQLIQKQELETDKTPTEAQDKDKEKIHVAVVIRNYQREPTHEDERSVKVALEVALLIELIILASIKEKKEQERVDEKQEQKLLDLVDRIKRDILKNEILKQGILKDEIKSKEFNHLVNKYINLPLEDLIKIAQVYSRSNNGKVSSSDRKIRVRLPGTHKMRPVASAA